MIRRHLGDEFLLIPQHQHALLSGELAARFGNARFAPPQPRPQTIDAVSLHDCGWPLHDDCPTLNAQGLPLDVFETPLPLALKVWEASADRAGERSPYAQLLVSLHVLGLSAFAASHPHTPRELFELNRFQHREVERQEQLRRRLGMSVDIPLHLGLAMDRNHPDEEQLRYGHMVLQIADRISLALCCTKPPFDGIDNVVDSTGGKPFKISLLRIDETELAVDPWPFDQPSLELEVLCRAVPARAYPSAEEFRTLYQSAEIRQLALTIERIEL